MAKKKKYDTSQDEVRKQALQDVLRALNPATLVQELQKAWNGFLRLWEAAYDLREEADALMVPGDKVRAFLSCLDRAMALNLPRQLYDKLEGRCGKS